MKTLLIALLTLISSSALAQQEYGSVDYLYGWQEDSGAYQTAIAIDLNQGWKTYWRVPGPAGIPPEFDWGNSDNIGSISWSWPTPHVFHTNGMMSIGYTGSVVIPVHITPADPSRPVTIDVSLSIGVCSDICIPADVRLTRQLSPAEPAQRTSDIRTALRDTPTPADQAGMRHATCRLTPSRRGFDIEANLDFSRNLSGNQQLIVEYNDPAIWIAAADTIWSGTNVTGTTEIQYFGNGMLSVDRSKLRVTLIQDSGLVEFFGCSAS